MIERRTFIKQVAGVGASAAVPAAYLAAMTPAAAATASAAIVTTAAVVSLPTSGGKAQAQQRIQRKVQPIGAGAVFQREQGHAGLS